MVVGSIALSSTGLSTGSGVGVRGISSSPSLCFRCQQICLLKSCLTSLEYPCGPSWRLDWRAVGWNFCISSSSFGTCMESWYEVKSRQREGEKSSKNLFKHSSKSAPWAHFLLRFIEAGHQVPLCGWALKADGSYKPPERFPQWFVAVDLYWHFSPNVKLFMVWPGGVWGNAHFKERGLIW